ncbi:MAG: arsenic efflux protein [Clostridia bacterium]|nr:arsenic efflux protein [Clostridia bacterium]
MIDILLDAIIDTAKILPFLFITYAIMEYIEHKMSEKSKTTIKKAGKWGPLLGSTVGIIPQCGFSASATNLYSARVISLGTLLAVYLSTSDEMIPIFISEKVPILTLVKILAIKFIIGIIFGFIIDFVYRVIKQQNQEEEKIEDICEHEHCHCEENGIFKSAIKHTISILIYIFIITLIINCIVEWVGEDNIATFVGNHAILGPAISSLIGLIPNCAASVIITNLYIQNIISGASLIAGLLTGAGVGLIILFKTNKNIKENIAIVGLLYAIGVFSGIVLQLIGIV